MFGRFGRVLSVGTGNKGEAGVWIDFDGREITFVGPDPYNKHNFYGTITKKQDGTFVVK